MRQIRESQIETGDLTTISDFWAKVVAGRAIPLILTVLTASSCLIVLFVELYIGSAIGNFFLRDIVHIPNGDVWAFVFIGLLVIAYVRVGGLRAVVKTDAWQLRLMITAAVCMLLFGLFAQPKPGTMFELSGIFFVGVTWKEIALLWVLLGILNFISPFTQLSSWQRVAACSEKEQALKGFIWSRIPFLTIWWLPVIGMALLYAKGYRDFTVETYLASMQTSGGIVEGLLYPLVFIGFAAALFSTADTSLIACQMCFADKTTFFSRLSALKERRLRWILTLEAFVIVVLLASIFAVAKSGMVNWFMPLVYAIFSQLSLAAPHLIYAFRRIQRGEKTPLRLTALGKTIIALGLILGWAAIISATLISAKTGDVYWSQITALIGIAISALFLAGGLRLRENQQPEAPDDF